MYGDPYFEYVTSTCANGSANGQTILLGNYGGLSDLNNDDIVHLFIEANTHDIRVGTSPSNDIGLPIYSAGSGFDWPAIRAGDASQLLFANRQLDNNASPVTTIFRQVR